MNQEQAAVEYYKSRFEKIERILISVLEAQLYLLKKDGMYLNIEQIKKIIEEINNENSK